MARVDISGGRLEEMAQREELVQERTQAADQREEALRMREEVVKKREEAVGRREAAATMREDAVKGQERALQEKDKVIKKREGALKKKEEELCKREEALKKQTKRIRASAAGSSSPPRQPPPPGLAPHIHHLPDKVLEMIFGLLSLHTIVEVLSVCRRWRDVIEDRSLIKELKFKWENFTTQEALCLIRSAPKLESLEVIWHSHTIALLDAASVRCTNLLHLSVRWYHDCGSLVDTLRTVFQTCPHITDVRLFYFSPSEDLMYYHELGTLLPDLRKLEFGIPQLSDLQLDALIDGCSHNQMEEFKAAYNPCSDAHLAKLVQFWGRSLQELELDASELTDGALALLGGCSELRRLWLYSLRTRGDWLHDLAALSHLETLNFHHRSEFNSENWCRFFSQSRSSHILRKLFLRGCSGLDDNVLSSVAASCPQLQELEVNGTQVTISGVREVLRCCHKLHNLNVDRTVPSVAHIVPELPQLAPQLRRICISFFAKFCLGEATLSRVQAQMPHLRIDTPAFTPDSMMA